MIYTSPAPSSEHCIRRRSEFIVCFLQRKDRRKPRRTSTEGAANRGGSSGALPGAQRCPSCVRCSQHTATAPPRECKYTLWRLTTPVLSFAASSLGEGRAIITMKPKGKEPRGFLPAPFPAIASHCFPQEAVSGVLGECKQTTPRSAKAISPSIVLPARNPITEQCACISREQRGKMRTGSCVALCIPLHLELLSCYIPGHQEYRVRLTAILTSTRWSLPPAWHQSLLCYPNRKGTTKKGFAVCNGFGPVRTRL